MDYLSYREFLAKIFPSHKRIRKLPLNGGMTCPNLDGTKSFSGCAYCNNRSFSPVWNKSKVSVEKQLEEGLVSFRKKNPEAGVLAYFQPYTNTYAPVEVLREIYSPVWKSREVAGISIGTRPDCLSPEVISLLAEINRDKPVIVEVGLQTSNDKTLCAINRRHTFADFENAVHALHRVNLCVTTHLIIGLPGESLEDFISTARAVRRLGISAAKLHPLHIVCGTAFAKEYADAEFELLTFEEYCLAIAHVIIEFGREVAVERFSGESPSELLIAPNWCGDREKIIREVEKNIRALKKNA